MLKRHAEHKNVIEVAEAVIKRLHAPYGKMPK
jgi:hypothetical protein